MFDDFSNSDERIDSMGVISMAIRSPVGAKVRISHFRSTIVERGKLIAVCTPVQFRAMKRMIMPPEGGGGLMKR